MLDLEIINVYNGEKYGFIGDCEINFDIRTGEILNIGVTEGKISFFSFKDEGTVEIPWDSKINQSEKTIIFDYKL